MWVTRPWLAASQAAAKAADMGWLPADDYADCAFGLSGVTKNLLDQLISTLRAPWMDTTENLLIKVRAAQAGRRRGGRSNSLKNIFPH